MRAYYPNFLLVRTFVCADFVCHARKRAKLESVYCLQNKPLLMPVRHKSIRSEKHTGLDSNLLIKYRSPENQLMENRMSGK